MVSKNEIFNNFENKTINSGELIELSSYCINNYNKHLCKTFYEKIICAEEGFYECPKGLTTYVKLFQDKKYIFTGFRAKNYNDRGKSKRFFEGNNIYNPLLECSNIEKMLSIFTSEAEWTHRENLKIKELQDAITKKQQALDIEENLKEFFVDLKHETIYWSSEIQALSESMLHASDGKKKDKNLLNMSTKIYHFSRLIGFNFSRFDMLNDSLTTSTFEKESVRLHKRFNMMIRCLEPAANKKSVYIERHGESKGNAKLNLETFDILPYALIENAIKYSPINENISISFKDDYSYSNIQIESVGPKIEPKEYISIFEKGYRGVNARNSAIKGNGIGLFLVKRVCEIHEIKFNVDSKPWIGYTKLDRFLKVL